MGIRLRFPGGGSVVEPPPAPSVSLPVYLSLWSDHQPVPGVDGVLRLDDAGGTLIPSAFVEGRLRFMLPLGVPYGHGATLTVADPTHSFRPYEARIITGDSVDLDLPTPHLSLPGLYAAGGVFRERSGARWTWKGITSFQLYQRYLFDQNIEPVLAQLGAVGANLVRVLGLCEYMFSLHPQAFGDRFYTALPDFCALLADYQLYMEFVAFADTQVIVPQAADQVAHWRRLGDTLNGVSNVVVELVNENNQHQNGVSDPLRFARHVGVLCSHGSNGAGDMPVRPVWDYETFHYNDMSEWQRKTAHNPMEDGTWQTHVPAVANENTRFPDHGSRADLAYAAGAGAALLTAGSTFHCVSGKTSQVITDEIELHCAEAWFAGAQSVPLEFQDGAYFRPETSFLRTYQRVLGDGRTFTVNIPA